MNPFGNNVKADCTEAESNAVRPSGLLGQIAIISPTDAHEQSVSVPLIPSEEMHHCNINLRHIALHCKDGIQIRKHKTKKARDIQT